ETAPVLTIPGNHDVQWWRRPFIPFSKDAVYQKYRSYLGAELTPTLTIPGGAVIASALTAHGVAWGSLTPRLRDIAVKGHLPKRSRGGRPVSFNVVTIDPTAVQVTFFRWDSNRRRFQPSDTAAFARKAPRLEPQAAE